MSAGFVIPPADIRPQGPLMEAAQGLSGKIKTAQAASAKNQSVTDDLARKALGMRPTDELSRDSLEALRKTAGQAYAAVGQTGTVAPGQAYDKALDAIVGPLKKAAQGFPNSKPSPIIQEIESLRSSAFDADSAIEKVKELRELADKAYGQQDKAAGKAFKAAAGAIEDALDAHLTKIGAPAGMLDAFRSARQLIAKSYTVQSALNGQTGNVNAQALASQLKRGKPLSGELEKIAKAGEAFPRAMQQLKEAPGQISPLDWAMASIRDNPFDLLTLGARPAVRAAILSGPAQRYAASGPTPNALQRLAGNPTAVQLGYRAAPVLAADQ